MNIHGAFTIYPGDPERELRVENSILDEGEIAFLKMIAQADGAVIANSSGNFYVGLCSETVSETLTLATMSTEPDSTGGYARQAVARSSTGWPNTSQVNGVWRIYTGTINFSASGADFSDTFTRLFLCNVASGTSGKLLSISGALPTAQQIEAGQTFPCIYELYLN